MPLPHRLPRPEPCRQIPPRHPGPIPVHDPLDDLTVITHGLDRPNTLVFLTYLATTYVDEGEIDKGAEVAAEAAAALPTAGNATSAERLHELRALVQPWQGRGSVKELDERLALV